VISVEEALQTIMDCFQPLEPEQVDILEGLGRVLAEDLHADIDIPPFDNAAMDGYALRASDVATAAKDDPARLQVVGSVPAGRTSEISVGPGMAVRIMTGAPLPAGADAVVPFEQTLERGPCRAGRRPEVEVYSPVAPADYVRPRGEDVRVGELVLARGTLVRPQEIGVLASLGRSTYSVVRRPRVAIVATGDELVGINDEIAPGKIRSSNEYSIAALVRRYGGTPIRLGVACDTVQDIRAKIDEGLSAGADLFLTSAGVSVGDRDAVKDVLEGDGEMRFWQVRMKPGKPLAFGEIRGVPLIGLPGNPVAAMVCFEQFARPAILKMLGWDQWEKPTVQVILDHDIMGSDYRSFVRAVVERREDGYHASAVRGGHGSGVLTSMVKANALLLVPEDVGRVSAGETLSAQMLGWPEEVLL
jgi:molybdopterin molybdotransferase